jgi:anti-sigma regulatory factor (Ser/Thr protein kinase)
MVITVETSAPLQRWRFDPQWSDVSVRVRRELCAALERASLDAARVLDAELIFAELIGNALRHAPGTVELILEARDDRVVLHFLDKGPGFAFIPRLPSDLYSEVGRGVFLIAHFANNFIVERRPGGGSHARITFSIHQGDSSV